MISEKKTNNNKIELSLSAIMFFSPLIQNLLKKNKNITEEEKGFIKGFIKIGYLNIILLIITIGLQITFYMTKIGTIQTISLILIIILAASLTIGSIYAISGKAIIKNSSINNRETTQTDKLSILLNYIPLYNIYLWYKKHEFENPDIILKESLLRWSVYSIAFISFSSPTINRALLSILLIRVIMLMNDINLGTKTINFIQKLFKKNPEELRGYISGTIVSMFNKQSTIENINRQKHNFELLFKLENKQILFEYIVLFGLSIYGLYKGYIIKNIAFVFAILFILCRYMIMIVKRNHMPHIPFIREVTNIFFKKKNT